MCKFVENINTTSIMKKIFIIGFIFLIFNSCSSTINISKYNTTNISKTEAIAFLKEYYSKFQVFNLTTFTVDIYTANCVVDEDHLYLKIYIKEIKTIYGGTWDTHKLTYFSQEFNLKFADVYKMSFCSAYEANWLKFYDAEGKNIKGDLPYFNRSDELKTAIIKLCPNIK